MRRLQRSESCAAWLTFLGDERPERPVSAPVATNAPTRTTADSLLELLFPNNHRRAVGRAWRGGPSVSSERSPPKAVDDGRAKPEASNATHSPACRPIDPTQLKYDRELAKLVVCDTVLSPGVDTASSCVFVSRLSTTACSCAPCGIDHALGGNTQRGSRLCW